MIVEEKKIIDKHPLAKVLNFFHIGEIKINQAMSNVRIPLVDTIDKVPNAYNTSERWVVKKMKPEYVNRIATILPIIY
jgi:hypothetical protein